MLGITCVTSEVRSHISSSYDCKKDEVKLVTCLYDKSTGQFNGLKLQLAYIVLRGDREEVFFSYGVNEKKSSVLYSVPKEKSQTPS